ncbi:MarR family winged helix-turn-helix transcriptional regulator [Paraflavitalea pollutisoli]|uniref:MarR family winged helix-turn-helix transcriptional regulator n=1 Tax=Paraflavitalea pollutisoli TaxID=3034143 RepID=UPI0023EBC9DB|nr:MarR family transcriptional regulator [Paraflavitalea sp. H1-2-19X]
MSSFDPAQQLVNLDSKIIASLGKLGEVFRVLYQSSAQHHGLSATQLQLLHYIHYHPDPAHRRGAFMSREFNVTKATVSDSIKALEQKGLVQKITDERDTRSFILSLTPPGETLAIATAGITRPFETTVGLLPLEQKEILTHTLFELIHRLNQAGVITTQRMCLNCRHYSGDHRQDHYCNLVQQPLLAFDLRLECPEFVG